jgi:phage protein D
MAAKPIPIYEGQDFYVPQFQVKVQGRPQGKNVIRDIIQVVYKDNIKEIDSFEITINNWDADKRTFKYSNQDLFDPGKAVELWMGYYGQSSHLMIKGEIKALRPSFPASGQPTLVITGLNMLDKLRTKQESHRYEQITDSELVAKIAKRLGIEVCLDSATTHIPYNLVQDNAFDIIFLMERAHAIGYEILVKETGEDGQSKESCLYFGPSERRQQVTYQLKYGLSLIQFQPNLNTANQVKEVTVTGWDPKQKKKIKVTVNRDQIITKGPARFSKAFKDRQEIKTDLPVESEAEARELATRRLEQIAKQMITGSGSTVGLPDLRAGSVVFIEGLDDLFSGRYFVTATTHTINESGYITQFECRREDV